MEKIIKMQQILIISNIKRIEKKEESDRQQSLENMKMIYKNKTNILLIYYVINRKKKEKESQKKQRIFFISLNQKKIDKDSATLFTL